MLETLMTAFWLLIGFIVFIIFVMIYNRIVSYKQSANSAKSSISVELKKRSDLIPEIINSVKGFVKHEDELMTKLTNIRNTLSDEFMKTFVAVAEEYPNLRSSEAFLQLQNALENTEKNIAASRHIYNSNVDYYNSLINSFPAMIFGFQEMKYLEFEGSDKDVVNVPTDFK